MARRKHSTDSSDEDYPDTKRRIANEDVQETLETLIYELGDKDLYTLPNDIQAVSTVIKKDSTILRKEVLEILANCAKNIPEKLTIFVTLIGLVNAKDYSLGEEFVELLLKYFKKAIKIGNHDDTKFLLRFMSDLINTNVIHASSLMVLYNVLVSQALEGAQQLCSDWLVYIVMYSLPWCVAKLAFHCNEELEKLLQNIEAYKDKRRMNDHLTIFQVWMESEWQVQEDYIDCLWSQLKNMRSEGWKERVLWRLYNDPLLAIVIQQSRPHRLPQLSLTLSVSVYPLPTVIFRLFDYTDVLEDELQTTKTEAIPSLEDKNNNPESDVPAKEEMDVEVKPQVEQLILPGSHSIERFLVEEQYRIIINAFNTNRKLCAKALIALPMRVRLPISYMIVETVLGEMFKLPKPNNSVLYYNSLLLELCREASGSIPLVLAQVTEMLFDHLEQMRPICIERFMLWFTHHLSNFKYQWSWTDWAYCSQDNFNKPKTRFIIEVLQRLMRLAFYDHIKSIVPQEFTRLLPKPPGSVNKYGEGAPRTLSCQKAVQQLMMMMRTGTQSDEIVTFLKGLETVKAENEPVKMEVIDDTAAATSTDADTGVNPKKELADGDDDSIDENDQPSENGDMETENYGDEQEERKESPQPVSPRPLSPPQTNSPQPTEEPKSETIDSGDQLYPGVTKCLIDVMVTALLSVGCKTFTHTFLYIDKFSHVLHEFIQTDVDQLELLHSVFGVWQEQQQYMVVITQRLIDIDMVNPRVVICWLFSDEMFQHLNCFYLWEIIGSTLDRASIEENSAWNKLQEIEDANDESDLSKTEARKSYGAARRRYMDHVIQVLSGLICRLNQYSTKAVREPKYSMNLAELLFDYGENSMAVDPLLEVSDESRFWLLGRLEGLLINTDLPHNFVLKQLDEFFKKVQHAPDQVLEIYGTFRTTVNQS